MASVTQTLEQTQPENNLRTFDARRDLEAVADLIEQGFAENLDEDGRRFLQHMRSAASSYRSLGWFGMVGAFPGPSMSGYVWEEEGRVVANISLFPFVFQGRRQYLIANVVVHPDFRRRGIARSLTTRAIEQARASRSPAVWLHVREENHGAIAMYESLGFQERARRTSWKFSGEALPSTIPDGLTIGIGLSQDWTFQSEWLRRNYPPELSWHLPLELNLLRPGVIGWIARLVQNVSVRHWSIRHDGQPLAVLTYQSNFNQNDALWLAAPTDISAEALRTLLLSARRTLSPRLKTQFDYPAHHNSEIIESAGFKQVQTLIWMKLYLA